MRGVTVPLSLAPHPHRSEGPGAGGSAREPLGFGGRPNASQPPQSQAWPTQCWGRGRTSSFLAVHPKSAAHSPGSAGPQFSLSPPPRSLFLFIEFTGVALVNTIIQVSGAQFYRTSSVQCVVCSPPQVQSPSINTGPPSPSSTSPPPSLWHSPQCPLSLRFFP